ncbi:unnamed protein product [Mesocestoides corti]|uniref:Secreted protein n=1 Tax=Mesocestoides corti TaxID=53468 RepID=A0A0R3U2U5_MESCO|nr:unnamed protein product [Mesocestoides corti]
MAIPAYTFCLILVVMATCGESEMVEDNVQTPNQSEALSDTVKPDADEVEIPIQDFFPQTAPSIDEDTLLDTVDSDISDEVTPYDVDDTAAEDEEAFFTMEPRVEDFSGEDA